MAKREQTDRDVLKATLRDLEHWLSYYDRDDEQCAPVSLYIIPDHAINKLIHRIEKRLGVKP